jgi:hypothetical protein
MAPPEAPTFSPRLIFWGGEGSVMRDAPRIALKCHAARGQVTHNLHNGFHRGMATTGGRASPEKNRPLLFSDAKMLQTWKERFTLDPHRQTQLGVENG